MLTLAQIIFGTLTLVLIPLFGFLGMIVLAALAPRRRRAAVVSRPSARRFLVVVPAHNEEPSIRATVEAGHQLDYDPSAYEIVVIADNCTDATAEVARAAGARVVERCDPTKRSKGHAIEYLLEQRGAAGELARFDAVVLIDADTVVDPGLLRAFSATLDEGADWAQGYYSVSNADASWRTRLLTYAFSLFNGVWLQGEDRIGLGAGFRGNGMCFSTRGLARVPWRAHGLVEDQEFAWMLRLAGEHVRFVPTARVYGEMVSKGASAVTQRQRWENGRRELRRRFSPALWASGSLSPWMRLVGLVDLWYPPQMRLQAGLLAALAIHPLAWMMPALGGLAWALFPLHALMMMILGVYALAPLVTLRLPPRYLLSLVALPYFAIWKLVKAGGSRADGWIRTPREATRRHAGG